jgi:large subunit ribosomal protein L31
MKPDIHPDYHEITVKMTNGQTFQTRSTYGKKGETVQLDVDPNSHPAWIGGNAVLNEKVGRVARFNEKFAGLAFGKKPAAATEGSNNATSDKKEDKK